MDGGIGMGRGITPRQSEVLALIAAGKTSKEIARELGISWRTVDQLVYVACQRIGTLKRSELVEWWELRMKARGSTSTT